MTVRRRQHDDTGARRLTRLRSMPSSPILGSLSFKRRDRQGSDHNWCLGSTEIEFRAVHDDVDKPALSSAALARILLGGVGGAQQSWLSLRVCPGATGIAAWPVCQYRPCGGSADFAGLTPLVTLFLLLRYSIGSTRRLSFSTVRTVALQ